LELVISKIVLKEGSDFTSKCSCSTVSVQDFNIACSVELKKLGSTFGTNYSDIWFGIVKNTKNTAHIHH
jgi:hypothetical protein